MGAALTVLPGGRGRGPGTVIMPRSRLVEDAMESAEKWRTVAQAASDAVQHFVSVQRFAELQVERERERAGLYDGKGAA